MLVRFSEPACLSEGCNPPPTTRTHYGTRRIEEKRTIG